MIDASNSAGAYMKETRNLLRGLVACGAALAIISALGTQAYGQTVAKVVRIKGSARFSTGGTFQPLKVGDVLKPGTLVQTDQKEGSCVDLVLGEGSENAQLPSSFAMSQSVSPNASASSLSVQSKANQNVIRLWSDTALSIDKLITQQTGAGAVSETELDLKRGRITGNVKKMPAGSKFDIKLPNNGIAGIRGTGFDICVTGTLWVRVINGAIVLAFYKTGETTPTTEVITGGHEINPATGVISPISPATMNLLMQIVALLTNPPGPGGVWFAVSQDKTITPVSQSAP
jgi:hypothetical protein